MWIRRLPFYDKPILATSNGDSFTFTITVNVVFEGGTYDRTIDYLAVHSWKYRYLADELAGFPPPP